MTRARSDASERTDAVGREHASFKNFVCWSPDRVSKIMDTEALQPAPEVFLATHTSIPMYRTDLSDLGDLSTAGGLRPYDEARFLGDFLATEDFALVAVLGGAGTGKSHLIRWLSTRIVQRPTRRVILVPRAGTSLHKVLRGIVDGLEGERFEEYRRRLSDPSTSMSLVEARTRLLDNLAIAIGSGNPIAGEVLTETENYLAAELPNLLRDPVFREHFLRPGHVLDRLATHVVGGSGIERPEARQAFVESDLPQRFQDAAKASRPADSIYRNLIANPPLLRAAVVWLNQHLDEAVANLMRMRGTDLVQLMLDVRVQLATRGVELVLLIEDLATLQGIDQQLLEALIVRPYQPDRPRLCALRTAVAMTGGYYEGLKKTVQQRFDFRVVMGEGDTRALATQADLEQFSARYLNAARLKPADLEAWYQRNQETSPDAIEGVPSACSGCAFREPCHRAFGAQEGMGLYPFSPIAVHNIGKRVSRAGFNPRTLLREGYKPILENDAGALKEGRFPPPELLERLGRSTLPAIVDADLQRLDPANYPRRRVLLNLWASAAEVLDLDPVIHHAFDLPALGGGTKAAAQGPLNESTQTNAPTPEPRQAAAAPTEELPPTVRVPPAAEAGLENQIQAIDAWSAGGEMSQDLMQTLRDAVYSAVVAHIDWNALHLLPGAFVGGLKGFRRGYSINFDRQYLRPGRAAIQLSIPLPEERPAEAALALQGLLRFRHYRSWAFPDGGRYYRAYLRHVNAWARHVLDQINRLTPSGSWDPMPAAVELLAVGARVLGRPNLSDPELPDLVDAVFSDLGPPHESEAERSASWRQLTKLVRTNQPKLRDLVIARVACSKGESQQVQMIDAARILPVLSRVSESWRPSEPIPTDLDPSSRFILEYRNELVELIDGAVREEREHELKRYQEVLRRLGAVDEQPDATAAKRGTASQALRRALEAAVSAGVLQGVQNATLQEKLDEFDALEFRQWVEAIQRVKAAQDFSRSLAGLSLVPVDAARVSSEALELGEKMLTRTKAAIKRGMGEHDHEGVEALDNAQRAINAGIERLRSAVRELASAEGE